MKKLPIILIILFIIIHGLSLYFKETNGPDDKLFYRLYNICQILFAGIITLMLKVLNRKNLFFKIIFLLMILSCIGYAIINIPNGDQESWRSTLTLIIGFIWFAWIIALFWTNFRLYAISFLVITTTYTAMEFSRMTNPDYKRGTNEMTRQSISDIPLLFLIFNFLRKPEEVDENIDPNVLHE